MWYISVQQRIHFGPAGTDLFPTLFGCSFLLTLVATPLASTFLFRPGTPRSVTLLHSGGSLSFCQTAGAGNSNLQLTLLVFCRSQAVRQLFSLFALSLLGTSTATLVFAPYAAAAINLCPRRLCCVTPLLHAIAAPAYWS